MIITKNTTQKEKQELVKSGISDYTIFLIGLGLVFLSNYSDLSQNPKTVDATTVIEQKRSSDNTDHINSFLTDKKVKTVKSDTKLLNLKRNKMLLN